MRALVKKISFGNVADLPSKDKPGTVFVAYDTPAVYVYDVNGEPQAAGSAPDPASYAEVVAVPASASSTGTAGQIAFASGFAYFCVATDTWERVAIATW